MSPNLGVGGRLEGRFFFQAVFGVDSGLSSFHLDTGLFHASFILGGMRICFPFRQWEGPRCLDFTPFKLGGREGFFFHFALFPNVFPWGSLFVPNRFSICSPSSQSVPQHVLHISTSLSSHMLWQMLLSFHLYRRAKGENLYTSKQNLIL